MAATAGFMIHVTCRLTAKNRDQLRNPTLGNRVWATCTFLYPRGMSTVLNVVGLFHHASALDSFVEACTVNAFKARLDKF